MPRRCLVPVCYALNPHRGVAAVRALGKKGQEAHGHVLYTGRALPRVAGFTAKVRLGSRPRVCPGVVPCGVSHQPRCQWFHTQIVPVFQNRFADLSKPRVGSLCVAPPSCLAFSALHPEGGHAHSPHWLLQALA